MQIVPIQSPPFRAQNKRQRKIVVSFAKAGVPNNRINCAFSMARSSLVPRAINSLLQRNDALQDSSRYCFKPGRYNTVRTLQWSQIDFAKRKLRFGKDKTDAGIGREVPLSSRALETLKLWAEHFPDRKPRRFAQAGRHFWGPSTGLQMRPFEGSWNHQEGMAEREEAHSAPLS